jgi:RNA polymerase sigma-70 factor (ECF subfamily)
MARSSSDPSWWTAPAESRPAYRPGSLDDFDRLYEATYPRLFRTLLAMLRDRAAAEDCVQETYLRAFRAWPKWRPDAPVEAWLHRIAINVAVTHHRRERLREVGEVIRRLGVPADPDPTDATSPELLRELRALPPKQAAALVLRHVHGYTNREIAHALNVPERTIASRLAAARARLQARLSAMQESGTWLAAGVPSDEFK